jgi:hypothetical protein
MKIRGWNFIIRGCWRCPDLNSYKELEEQYVTISSQEAGFLDKCFLIVILVAVIK